MGNIPEPVPKTCPSPVATGGLASITGKTAVRGGRAGRGRPCLSQSEARGQRPLGPMREPGLRRCRLAFILPPSSSLS